MAKADDAIKKITEKLRSEQQAEVRITNDNLVCKDCVQRFDDGIIYGNTSKCEFYPECKPTKVLLGGECDEYAKE